jgi:hypothetical protein
MEIPQESGQTGHEFEQSAGRYCVEDFNNHAGRALVIFLDCDKDIGGHHFCEVGVTEPDNDPTRSWFYNVDTKDELSKVDDRQKLERALHPTTSCHRMIANKIAVAANQYFAAHRAKKNRGFE